MRPDGAGHGDLIPARGTCAPAAPTSSDLRVAGVGADQRRIPIEEDELVPAAELEQRRQQLLGVDPDAAPVLVVVPQHDSDAHQLLRWKQGPQATPRRPAGARVRGLCDVDAGLAYERLLAFRGAAAAKGPRPYNKCRFLHSLAAGPGLSTRSERCVSIRGSAPSRLCCRPEHPTRGPMRRPRLRHSRYRHSSSPPVRFAAATTAAESRLPPPESRWWTGTIRRRSWGSPCPIRWSCW